MLGPKISRRNLAESVLKGISLASKPFLRKIPPTPKSIFILRNNGLGDLLCATPLFEMLKGRYPDAEIVVGIGSWHEQLLGNNPYLSSCVAINAPWHNQFVIAPNLLKILTYVLFSSESRTLSAMKHDIGFDVVGSIWGSMLLLRCGIPLRIGVKGYAGGHSATQKHITYDNDEHVAKACIKMGELLGISDKPSMRPQIYLSEEETCFAEKFWEEPANRSRIVIAPGGSFEEKRWGDQRFAELANMILKRTNHQICVIGGQEDQKRLTKAQFCGFESRIKNLCGKLSLRESAAVVSSSDYVISNSSLPMHLAGAFRIPSLTLLGEWYDNAKLHYKQWGYPEGLVLGKETSNGIHNTSKPESAFESFEKHSLESLRVRL